MSFISYLINGLSLGSVYAIIALGYTMVYGIAKMLNFAHGDVIMIGAYIALLTMSQAGMSPVIAVVAAVIVCTVLGVLIERIAYKPLRNASSSLAVLITAIGVSYLLQNIALLVFGANTPDISVSDHLERNFTCGRAVEYFRRYDCHYCSMSDYHGCAYDFCTEKQNRARQCRAVSEDKGRGSADGNQRKRNDCTYVRDWICACGNRPVFSSARRTRA